MFKNILFIFMFLCLNIYNIKAQSLGKVFPGADEATPSRAQYFSWINNTNEGATEEHTLINLEFFKWLQDEYGMTLDIYAFDAGAIDGKRFYGSTRSSRFKNQFPNGFGPVYEKAKQLNTRLGVWGGPDGFGDTPDEERERIEMMMELCRDYEFMLFKFDAVSGSLRPEKQDAFIEMMQRCREYSPDLILLNHRLQLGKGLPHATTSLWEGAESYIDVFMANRTTGTHHRVGALSRGLPPGLMRLTEDHGVCLSSCLDYWEDDLILQAFNRCLILAPQIYANPWLLRDDEFPRLARIYNLHRKYRDILVNGILLPESQYGPNAVSRGNENTRLITLRNLTWHDAEYVIQLDDEIGLDDNGPVEVRQYHPYEKYYSTFKYGDFVEITVPPFRSCLIAASSKQFDEPAVKGAMYEIVKNIPGEPLKVNVYGLPGTSANIQLLTEYDNYQKIELNNEINNVLLTGASIKVDFPGEVLKENWHRKLADLKQVDIPDDAEALYEATCFAADNNALEVRSLIRSGPTDIPQVQNARDALINQDVFIERGIWDKYLFDDNMETSFCVNRRFGRDIRINGGAFRLDLGKTVELDKLIFYMKSEISMQPLKRHEAAVAEISTDLVNWEKVFVLAEKTMTLEFESSKSFRYFRMTECPDQVFEVEGYQNGKKLDRTDWRASNLFSRYNRRFKAHKAWSAKCNLDEIPKGSYLAVAINGIHGKEGAYAAVKIDGKLIGAPDRAVSFQSNTWEYHNRETDRNYTYYIPLTADMQDKDIEVFVLGMNDEIQRLNPEVWITAYPVPYEKKELVLYRK